MTELSKFTYPSSLNLKSIKSVNVLVMEAILTLGLLRNRVISIYTESIVGGPDIGSNGSLSPYPFDQIISFRLNW